MRYRGTLSYDGTAYQGFQRQAGAIVTIQGEVERAAAEVIRQAVTVLGAGRTDTGVHASGQVIAFDAQWRHDTNRLLQALNAHLPDDIALIDLDVAPTPSFHPRFDAVSRIYRYTILNAPTRDPLLVKRAWHIRGQLEAARMSEAAALLIGTHDFGGFGRPPVGENTVRTIIRSEWTRELHGAGWLWSYTVEANAFLQHMVRRIVGVLVSVGRGVNSTEFVAELLRDAEIPGGMTVAPPQGLTLVNVRYSAGETPA